MSVNRCFEEGWEVVAVPDGRRGLWVKYHPNKIEFCAGREGDDLYLSLEVGQTLDESVIKQLTEIMQTHQYHLQREAESEIYLKSLTENSD